MDRMSVADIIKKALIYYDQTEPVIRYLQTKTTYTGIKTAVDNARTTLTFTDNDSHQIVLETEVEILAVYYDRYHLWSWSWAQTGLKSSENYLAKNLLRYSLDLDHHLTYLKSILFTSRNIIRSPTQIDINLAIAADILKTPYIYPYVYPINNDQLVYYLILLNVDQLNLLMKNID